MIRALFRLVLLLVVIAAIGGHLLGYWTWDRASGPRLNTPAVGTARHVDVDKARATGAEIGEKTAVATARARAALGDAELTAKIKSKMALDDTLQARGIDVSTSDGIVVLNGSVRSETEHQRAVELARETAGTSGTIESTTCA